ncbi:hypothetical protein DUI87_17089 [Hirundo rustica rustica]|uniref:Reverse transcriptase domain-containing protein n=1 Tax=Hirundo rustica rustica TaxID=333673 RepID=A0A3M0K365_HIRRU|nr:hypothetical protein DUI87_17089 [Hirundo rustica rustica]
MEHLILEVISKHVVYKKVSRRISLNSLKGKLCLTILIAFYHKTTAWMDEGRAVHFVYLYFSKAFTTVSHKILIDRLRKWGLDEWTVRWIGNGLNSRSQRVIVAQGLAEGLSPVVSLKLQYQAHPCLTYSSMTWMKARCSLIKFIDDTKLG